MNEINRYDLFAEEQYEDGNWVCEPCKNDLGHWVKFEDVEKLIKDLREWKLECSITKDILKTKQKELDAVSEALALAKNALDDINDGCSMAIYGERGISIMQIKEIAFLAIEKLQ